MMEESKRQAYLKAMDITEWRLRSNDHSEINESEQIIEQTEQGVEIQALVASESLLENSSSETNNKPTTKEEKEPVVLQPVEEPVVDKTTLFKAKGLTWLNQTSHNGLLVVLSEQRKNLDTESRQLMSNMLKSIHFLPSETGFATIAQQAAASGAAGSLQSVKAILVFGNEAGRDLVKISGARIIPGTEVFSLDDKKIVISLHPDEILADPTHKKQAWADLKQLVEFFNND